MERDLPSERVLIVAPSGHDAPAMASLLEREEFSTFICQGPAECAHQIDVGVGAVLLTEEALELPQIDKLLESLSSQPPWSELPVIILTTGGESRLQQLLDVLRDIREHDPVPDCTQTLPRPQPPSKECASDASRV